MSFSFQFVCLILDWKIIERVKYCRLIPSAPAFHVLKDAQQECMKDEDCGYVHGFNANEFEHSDYRLCHVDANNVIDDNYNYPFLPNGLYVKPGNIQVLFGLILEYT